MGDKRYDIVCKKARKKIKGIKCILDLVDSGMKFHDSVIERFEFDADKELLIVDIGDVWIVGQDEAARFRFIFCGYMEFQFDYDTGNCFTYEFSITSESRLNMFHVEFNSLHFEINCSDISIEALP
ncbi:MAG: hypothetical protein HDS64_03580 [Bacteroidales bacterium]|nr:hypothetical protein [Bacteroidales bacterium]